VAAELQKDPAYAARILDPLEMAGVERWADSSVIIRARFRVAPLEQWNVRREYLRRLKTAFDRAGIEIPFPQLTIHSMAESRAKPSEGEHASGAAPRPPRERSS
jgi:small conductance mechanosensitive channel